MKNSQTNSTPLFQSDDKTSITLDNAPLAYKLAPKSLAEYVGHEHLIGENKPLRLLIEQDKLCSLILWGPPGCGKTALSRLISKITKSQYLSLNAVIAKVSDIKNAIDQARYQKANNKKTILFIDEIHRFNKIQQDALLPEVENGLITMVGATTENPFFSVIPGLISRSQIFELQPLTQDNLNMILDNAAKKLGNLNLDDDAKEYLVNEAS